ncbi:MAG: NADPH:quinone oxidoreductase family protein [Pseudomonadota bacterium]
MNARVPASAAAGLMKAVLCTEYTTVDRLSIGECEVPPLFPDGVRVAMRVAAINPPDVLMAQGKYQVKPDLPFVPGLEGMGTVMEVGANVTDLKPGDRVMSYVGQGCFAEQAVIARNRLERVPEGMSDNQASGFVLVYSTAYHGLVDCGHLAAGDVLVVLGASGGIGLCAIQIGKALGATVIAVASTEEKLAKCKDNGADHLVNATTENISDRIKAITAKKGANVILDVVGGDVTEAALRGIAPYGRLLIAGYASGIIPNIKGNLVLLKQASVIGVSYRQHLERNPAKAAANLRTLCDLYSAGKLHPEVGAEYTMAQIVDALKEVGERRAIGKVAVKLQ